MRIQQGEGHKLSNTLCVEVTEVKYYKQCELYKLIIVYHVLYKVKHLLQKSD